MRPAKFYADLAERYVTDYERGEEESTAPHFYTITPTLLTIAQVYATLAQASASLGLVAE